MRKEEAQWIEGALTRFVLGAGAPPANRVALNLGSGDIESQRRSKPWVHERTIAPLERAGFRILHSDLVAGPGVDRPGDLLDPAFQAELAALAPEVVFACNLFEHLPRDLLRRIPRVLAQVVAPGGYLVVTVPRSYPYHADPIDTLYRPTPGEIASLFPEFELVSGAEVASASYGEEFAQGSLRRKIGKVLRLFFPFVRPRRWLSHVHRFFWLARPYRISCALLRRHAPR